MYRMMMLRAMLPAVMAAGGIAAHAQGLSNWWISGYESDLGDPPYGGSRIDFRTGTPQIEQHDMPMYLAYTAATIADGSGALLFYTNGYYIADASDQPMVNGEGLNPSFYTEEEGPTGLAIVQADLVLPPMDATGRHWLIHTTADTFDTEGYFVSRHIYRTTVDMTLNGGLGEVVEKNEELITDSLEPGGLACVRHANGRDWWVMAHGATSDEFVRVLITPDTVLGPYHQSIGAWRGGYSPSGVFSPDGSRFACMDGVRDLDVFDFDRCTGELYNARHADIGDEPIQGTAAFSPSGDRLYVTSYDRVFQYDLTALDLASSRTTVAVWDSTYDTYPFLRTMFWVARLAPDGKVYISTGNGTRYLHVVNEPDQLGGACDLQQHALMLPTFNANSIPYHPNYWLGPVDGSVCDSLGINTGVATPLAMYVQLFPNPSNGHFTVGYQGRGETGLLEVVDAAGRIVQREVLPPWSSVRRVELPDVPPGMYACKLHWPSAGGSVRVLIIH